MADSDGCPLTARTRTPWNKGNTGTRAEFTGRAKTFSKCSEAKGFGLGRSDSQKSYNWERPSLRARRKWPRDRRPAEQRHELSPSHAVTPSRDHRFLSLLPGSRAALARIAYFCP
jgi:hypothetical protein